MKRALLVLTTAALALTSALTSALTVRRREVHGSQRKGSGGAGHEQRAPGDSPGVIVRVVTHGPHCGGRT